jgi:hypothetical protein
VQAYIACCGTVVNLVSQGMKACQQPERRRASRRPALPLPYLSPVYACCITFLRIITSVQACPLALSPDSPTEKTRLLAPSWKTLAFQMWHPINRRVVCPFHSCSLHLVGLPHFHSLIHLTMCARQGCTFRRTSPLFHTTPSVLTNH